MAAAAHGRLIRAKMPYVDLLHAHHRPAGRTSVRWTVDVLLVLVAYGAALPNLLDASPPPVWTYVLLAVAVLPLLVRRVWPTPAFVALLVVGGVVFVIDQNILAGFGINLGLLTVAAERPRREALGCAALAELGAISVAAVFPAHRFANDLLLLTVSIIASVGLGLYIATRRAYLQELRDRADRVERERDQQVALAAASERARIARELHDIVAHHLTVMVAMSDGAIAASQRSPERGVEAMRTVSATGRLALGDTRRLLGVLRAEPSDDDAERRPLPDLGELDELIERVRAAGLPVSVEIRGARVDLPDGMQLTVYRLVQEALTNTLKHGGSDTHAVVRLDYRDDEVIVEIEDDGAGAAARVPDGSGGGVVGMRQRVQAFGGEFDSGPRHTGGWRIGARLPVDGAMP